MPYESFDPPTRTKIEDVVREMEQMLDEVSAPTPAVKVEDVRPRRRLMVRKEHSATRCEICHQSDLLVNGECERCRHIGNPAVIDNARVSTGVGRLFQKIAGWVRMLAQIMRF